MSEKPQLTRRQMRERGMLNNVSSADGPSPVERLTQTSELKLRRPSRKELREQRESNESIEARTLAKFNTASLPLQASSAPQMPSESSPSVSSAPPTVSLTSQPTSSSMSAPASSYFSQVHTQTAYNGAVTAVGMSPVPAVSEPSQVLASEQYVSSANFEDPRKSVFDRFSTHNSDSSDPAQHDSLQDKLVAKTQNTDDVIRHNTADIARKNTANVPAKNFSFPQTIAEETDLSPFGEVTEEELQLLALAEAEEDERFSEPELPDIPP